MIRPLLLLALLGCTAPARAQDHSMHDMAMPGMAHDMPAAPATPPPGNDTAPMPPVDRYADRTYSKAEMDRAHAMMMAEDGGRSTSMIMVNLAEYRIGKGQDTYHWDGEAWFGGDIDRLTFKTEGEGTRRAKLDSAEVQALYSHAIDPYFNLQAGIRQDIRPTTKRSYATIGIEGLAPYMFDLGAALFLSNKGELLGRIEASYDQRITQRLILQPRIELNLSAQDVTKTQTKAGLSSTELGLRLRYEIVREFAPYVGAVYEAQNGGGRKATSFVLGVRAWF